jgi:hypothetical protein
MRIKLVFLGLTSALVSSLPAQAAITIYTDLAAFTAATTAPGVDTFTGFSTTASTPTPILRSAGSYTYSASTRTSFFGGGTFANPFLSPNTATDTMTFNGFVGGVQAAGGNFFGSNISGVFQPGDITITATDASGTVTQTIVGATTDSFLGFVSDGALTSFTVVSVQPAVGFLWPSLDNLVLARRADAPGAIPEPATWAMMIVGFGMVGGAMRRRNAAPRLNFVL